MDTELLRDKLLRQQLVRAVVVEFLGTTLFLFLLTAGLIPEPDTGTVTRVSFTIGLSIAILAHVFGPISGGHFNPAITLATVVTGDSGLVKCVTYIIAQIVGGIAGSAITYGLNPSHTRDNIDGLRLAAGYTITQGFFVELLLTSVLVFAFLASTSDDNNRKDFGFANALAVGLSITLACLVGIPYTGTGINPARSFGPSVVVGEFQSYHWIYWIAPICGGVVSGLLYRFVVKVVIARDDLNEASPLIANSHH